MIITYNIAENKLTSKIYGNNGRWLKIEKSYGIIEQLNLSGEVGKRFNDIVDGILKIYPGYSDSILENKEFEEKIDILSDITNINDDIGDLTLARAQKVFSNRMRNFIEDLGNNIIQNRNSSSKNYQPHRLGNIRPRGFYGSPRVASPFQGGLSTIGNPYENCQFDPAHHIGMGYQQQPFIPQPNMVPQPQSSITRRYEPFGPINDYNHMVNNASIGHRPETFMSHNINQPHNEERINIKLYKYNIELSSNYGVDYTIMRVTNEKGIELPIDKVIDTFKKDLINLTPKIETEKEMLKIIEDNIKHFLKTKKHNSPVVVRRDYKNIHKYYLISDDKKLIIEITNNDIVVNNIKHTIKPTLNLINKIEDIIEKYTSAEA